MHTDNQIDIEKGKRLFSQYIPETAQALIVAERHIDQSDSMTDYFNHTVSNMIIIGYSDHKRDMFSEMRKAAERIPETAHLGRGKGHFRPSVIINQDFKSNGGNYYKGQFSRWHTKLTDDAQGKSLHFQTLQETEHYIQSKGEPGSITFEGIDIPFVWKINEEKIEHREKWSMGSGYYLKDGHSNSSGWCVKKMKKWNDRWSDDVYVSIAERCIFEEKKAVVVPISKVMPNIPAIVPSKVSGVTIRKNEEKNGIEIVFPAKPAQGVIDNLKANNWRWSRFNMCWYNRDTPENMEFAETLAGETIKSDIPANISDNVFPLHTVSHTTTKPASDIAGKLRKLADGMEKAIDSKFNSGVSQQNPTRRRLMIAEGMRHDGENLRKVQFLLRSLADMHENNTVSPELVGITSKTAAHDAIFGYNTKTQAAIDIVNGTPKEDPKEKTLRDLDRELIGCKIPGFFVTPKPVAEMIIELAGIKGNMEVLEPSAGRGNIAECVNHGSKLTCIEYQQKLAGILKLRGFDTICGDFLEHTGQYDRVVMNPPFENFQDIQHVKHAYQCLKNGGRLVSVMGEGVFFRSDRIPTEFRQWMEDKNAEVIDLPAGTFQGTITSTGVKARIVVIDKN